MDDKLAAWLHQNTIGTDTLIWDQPRPYLIIGAKVEGLPHFAGYPDGELLFVSVSVPPEYRRYVLIHEIIKQESTNQSYLRCFIASRKEAELFEDEHRDTNERLRYWAFRVEFFAHLIAYEGQTNPESERLATFPPSLAYFESLEKRDSPI